MPAKYLLCCVYAWAYFIMGEGMLSILAVTGVAMLINREILLAHQSISNEKLKAIEAKLKAIFNRFPSKDYNSDFS